MASFNLYILKEERKNKRKKYEQRMNKWTKEEERKAREKEGREEGKKVE